MADKNNTQDKERPAYEIKAEELAKKLKCKVYPMVFLDPVNGEEIIGYLREPNRETKFRYADRLEAFPTSAKRELLIECLIAEESDKRIMSEDPKYDGVHMGASRSAGELVRIAIDLYKKKFTD